ncbi:MAG: HIT family protein [Caldilinea sp. CFX5]|nr:HIT family protein [Caldilinea sp. CFX5]
MHSYNTSLLGWLVLIARRHIASIDEMSEAEAAALGPLLRQVSTARKAVTGCSKTYVVQFAEAPGHPHVHFHVIPRMADLPVERRSTNIFTYLGVPTEEWLSEAQMNEIALKIQPFLQM